MSKILGIDLGTNSIGWAIRNPQSENEDQIEDYGVVVFQKGVGEGKSGEYSLAAERRSHRLSRRRYNALRYRKWATLKVLIENDYCPLPIERLNEWKYYEKGRGRVYPADDEGFQMWIKLDFDQDGKPDFNSPYQLRRFLLHNKLDFEKKEDRYMLGRALYHIAQRRGFKSHRKDLGDQKNEEAESEEKRAEATRQLMKKHNAITLGEALAKEEELPFTERENTRVRKEYTGRAIRSQYKEEIKKIFEKQGVGTDSELYSKLVETDENKNNGTIFYTRPLRSQKGLVGKCTFETDKPRIPVSHPYFEEFRALSFLNNVRFKPEGEKNWKKIPEDILQEVYEDKFFRTSKPTFKFEDLEKGFYKAFKDKKLSFNFKSSVTVSGCPVSAYLKNIFGENWRELSVQKPTNDTSQNSFYDLEDVWHVLFSFDNEENIQSFGREKLNLNEDQIKKFLNAWGDLPDGYGSLSIKAIKNILPFLRNGYGYTEAVLLAKLPDLLGEDWYSNQEDIKRGMEKMMEQYRQEKLAIDVTNNLISDYYALPDKEKFGYRDTSYVLTDHDESDIEKGIEKTLGAQKWNNNYSDSDAVELKKKVRELYQQFFTNQNFAVSAFNGKKHSGRYYKIPRIQDTMKEFLKNEYSVSEDNADKLYHPSDLEMYPKQERNDDGIFQLGDPANGALKNPMAMRTLYELRKLINTLLRKGKIDERTRIVVEISRELNDANLRKAYKNWIDDNEKTRNEIKMVIEGLKKEKEQYIDPENQTNLQAVQLWMEQLDGDKKELLDKSQKKKKEVDKYRLWMEQNCRCIYTGRMIPLSELFEENGAIDLEHTIPRSISFDNSMANLTLCDSDYNRNVKKNRVPVELENYDENWRNYPAIKPMIKHWEQKRDKAYQDRENAQNSAKIAQMAMDEDGRNKAIQRKHYFNFEYQYWKNKVERFQKSKDEITEGFKNSQLKDTQIITKYARAFLKSVFGTVNVEKGEVVSQFREIYNIYEKAEKKDRSSHAHHAKDAAVLTFIPPSAERDAKLKEKWKREENSEPTLKDVPYIGFHLNHVNKIDNGLLVKSSHRDRLLTPAKKYVRKRGKKVTYKDENGNIKYKIAQGDSVRGKLHNETFYGPVKLIEREENGKPKLDDENNYIFQNRYAYVVNHDIEDFENLKEIKKKVWDLDPFIYKMIEKQVDEAGGFKKAIEDGIWMLNKKGDKVNRIRHLRTIASTVKNPLSIKEQAFPSNDEKKSMVNVENTANVLFALYSDGKNRSFESMNLYELADIKKHLNGEINSYLSLFPQEKVQGRKTLPLRAVLKPGLKVLLYNKDPQELYSLNISKLKNRLYLIKRLYNANDGRIQLQHHLEARNDEGLKTSYPTDDFGTKGYIGFTKYDADDSKPRLLVSPSNYNFLIESYDFEIEHDGSLRFNE